jgi:hypothetical protein
MVVFSSFGGKLTRLNQCFLEENNNNGEVQSNNTFVLLHTHNHIVIPKVHVLLPFPFIVFFIFLFC